MSKFLVTGASGQLGRRAIDHLANLVAKDDIVALVRSDQASADYGLTGIATRRGDYDDVAALTAAFAGIDRLLLVSSSAIGERARQHGNVIAAAKAAGVGFIAYTSVLHAQSSGMILAQEHAATETLLAQSGIPHTLLRNGWYTENLVLTAAHDLNLGQRFGAAKDGKFSLASRQDFAEAAAVVLAGGHDGEVLELGGDTGITLAEYATQLSTIAGKPVAYVDVPEATFRDALTRAALPEGFAAVLADTDSRAAEGWLYDGSKTLSALIGRPTTPVASTIKAALA